MKLPADQIIAQVHVKYTKSVSFFSLDISVFEQINCTSTSKKQPAKVLPLESLSKSF